MKWLIGIVAVVALAAGAGVWMVLPLAQVGSAYAAKAVCSGVFVAGMDADRVFREEVEHLSPAIALVNYTIDREEGVVRASLMGLGGRRAVHREGAGCTLAIGGDPAPLGAPAQGDGFAPLAARAAPLAQDGAVQAALDAAFANPVNGGGPGTRAVVVTLGGEVVAERYADGITASTPLKGWSMNKTLTGLLIGLLVDRGWLDPDAPAPVPEWAGAGDPRGAVTLRHLMTMSSGLDFDESYGDMQSDVVEMLFNERSAAARAARAALAHEPGTHWSYSSGTTNILARIARETLAREGLSFEAFIQTGLFAPIGVGSAVAEPDAAGDFVGSSFGYMAAHDWARIGRLLVDRGRSPAGEQVVSAGWIDFMTTDNALSGGNYGAQVWLNRQDPESADPPFEGVPADAVILSGHDGQAVVAVPSLDLVVVRLGETPTWTSGAGLAELLKAAASAAQAEAAAAAAAAEPQGADAPPAEAGPR